MHQLFLAAAVLSLFLTGPLLFLLRYLKARQVIREEGPSAHQAKTGTPTMGGLAFFLVIAALTLIFIDLKYISVVILAICFALIGFFDDLIKILNRQNLGLTFWQKIFLQTSAAVLFSGYLIKMEHITGSLWHLFYYSIFWTFIIVAEANAANLTDGLDGLLSGASIILFSGFGFILCRQDFFGAAALCFIIVGSLLGFIPFNFPKARIFMGDTGSLSIGALLAGIAIITHNEWPLLLISGVFVIEALSVIIQVVSFKLYKKRIFKMSPLHHHFELLGHKETTVVMGFWAMQFILSILAYIFT